MDIYCVQKMDSQTERDNMQRQKETSINKQICGREIGKDREIDRQIDNVQQIDINIDRQVMWKIDRQVMCDKVRLTEIDTQR